MDSHVIDSLTVPWIPVRHTVDVLIADTVPTGYDVTTAVAVALDSRGHMLLTRVDRPGRGWDVPGGHVEQGESPSHAAARELAEETGLSVPPDDLVLFGGLRITLAAEPPADYRYPARAYMAFHLLRLDTPGQPTRPDPDAESVAAEWFAADEVRRRCEGAVWLPLVAAVLG